MPLDEVGRPIRPWFGLPGLRARFYVGRERGNIGVV